MQHDLPRLAELGLADHEQTRGPVEIVAVKCDGFACAHAGGGQQTDVGLVRGGHEGMGHCASGRDQLGNLGCRVNEGLGAARTGREEVGRRYLMAGVHCRAGIERSHVRRSVGMPTRVDGGWQAAEPRRAPVRL